MNPNLQDCLGGPEAIMDAANRLQLIKERQAKWKQERQAELDRQTVMQELQEDLGNHDTLSATDSSKLSPWVLFKPEQVIDKLTNRITDRIRDELRSEMEKDVLHERARQEAASRKLETVLANEIESHTCPICYDLMVPPKRSPMLLFPCGHSFCQTCIISHTDQHRKTHCPICREKIVSKAPNYSLQQLILNFVQQRDKLWRGQTPPTVGEQGWAGAGGNHSNPTGLQPTTHTEGLEDEESRLHREYSTKSIRLKVLTNELMDSKVEHAGLQQSLAHVVENVASLERQKDAAYARLKAAQSEYDDVCNKLGHQQQKAAELEAQEQALVQHVQFVESTLSPLHEDLEKLDILLHGLREMKNE